MSSLARPRGDAHLRPRHHLHGLPEAHEPLEGGALRDPAVRAQESG